MKFYTNFIVFTLVLLLNINNYPQILNAGFENWTNDDPDDWLTLDILGFANSVSQSSDAHSGSSAARLEVVDIGGGNAYPAFMYSGADGMGFSVSQQHGSLTGYYKFVPQTANDFLTVFINMIKNDQSIGSGFWTTQATALSYTQFVAPITYFSPETPDTAYIWIAVYDSAGGSGTIGAYALIDDLSFGPSTDVQLENQNPSTFSLSQNYPNPFNPSTKINFSITEQSFVELSVYDILGNEITKLVGDIYSAGEYSVDFKAENLPGGVYIAKLSAGNYSNAIKMILLK